MDIMWNRSPANKALEHLELLFLDYHLPAPRAMTRPAMTPEVEITAHPHTTTIDIIGAATSIREADRNEARNETNIVEIETNRPFLMWPCRTTND